MFDLYCRGSGIRTSTQHYHKGEPFSIEYVTSFMIKRSDFYGLVEITIVYTTSQQTLAILTKADVTQSLLEELTKKENTVGN